MCDRGCVLLDIGCDIPDGGRSENESSELAGKERLRVRVQLQGAIECHTEGRDH